MRIGYDAKRAFLNNTGLGNYSRWLIGVMTRYYPENQYSLYTPEVKDNRHAYLLNHLPHTNTVAPGSKLLSSWWRTKGIVNNMKQDGVKLYHGLSHELPLGIAQSGIKSVLTVHDLIFMRFPQYFGWVNRMIYRAKLQYACKTADSIIAISQKTKDDLIELLQVPASKISVIYQSCDPVFAQAHPPAQKASIQQKYQLPEQFILTVGTIEERKNLMLLVKALSCLKAKATLVVVGKPTDYLNEVKAFIQQHQLTSQVIFLHQVSFDELPALYQLAQAFIYPSRYEGFGIPILEALNSGTPVIAAKGSCLEEAGGPHSLYVDPDDEQELATTISQVLHNEELRNRMITQGLTYARQFNDEALAEQYMQLYKNTLTYA
ncbi:glycosyltransferase family 4 protein [Mucilaginibacter robiniae]|uniref:Glycosyltransferase family 4 protein n=1 Tax=Mucilaginibacter robiniae TaxID=2728022 RepID=A0A7L5E3M0_9SPHI|nr:glycosyltransferase family 1 protein [Mucilaginibacter robiniae]QJD94926.1 glycosyltransferase family 4 protein [Mucilaginibacter robiniae]